MKLEERALLAWPVLCYAALHRQTMEYTTLSKLTGMGISGMGPMLEFIHAYCQREGLPALSVLVVQKESGQPGVGFTAAEDMMREASKVFNYKWLDRSPPTAVDLKAAAQPVSASENGLLAFVSANPGLSAREIAERLYPQTPYQQRVNTELVQLVELGLARREKEGIAFRYWSLSSR